MWEWPGDEARENKYKHEKIAAGTVTPVATALALYQWLV
jgi:hypothetical protein